MRFLMAMLKYLVFSSLYTQAEGKDARSLDENTRKHVRSALKSLVVLPGVYLVVRYGGSRASEFILYVSLAAQIAGLAWFVVTFAALPQRHLKGAMVTTEDMFASFLAGIYSLLMLAILSAPVSLLVVGPIYAWLYKAAALYDSADLLKAGKDEQELLAAQAIQRLEPVIRAMAKRCGVELEER
jgi:hypothetical protein